MFKKLLDIWSEQAFSSRVVEEFITMLENSEEMLSYAFTALTNKGKAKKVKKNIYRKDQRINLTEQDLRKQILIHLAANPQCNLSACLALISVSKDAERLGDYVKNLFELNLLLEDTHNDIELFQRLFDVDGTKLMRLFKKVADAFRHSDRKLASEAVTEGREISKRCDEAINEILESDYTARQAVVLALGSRYMKRIALHLSNIASSVINPLPELDYLKEKNLKKTL